MSTGFGETLLTIVAGGLSLTVSDVVAEFVEPLLSVAVTVMVNNWLLAELVEA
jgi:hypothetical protein